MIFEISFSRMIVSIDDMEWNLGLSFDRKVWPSDRLVHFGFLPKISSDVKSLLCFKDIIVNERYGLSLTFYTKL